MRRALKAYFLTFGSVFFFIKRFIKEFFSVSLRSLILFHFLGLVFSFEFWPNTSIASYLLSHVIRKANTFIATLCFDL